MKSLAHVAAIDIHSHWRPPGYADMMVAEAERDAQFAHDQVLSIRNAVNGPPPEQGVMAQLADMDAGGVGVSFVSLPPPGISFGGAGVSAQMAVVTNDALIGVAKETERFRVLVSLPLPHLDESLAELDRVAALPEVAGVQVLATGRSRSVSPDAAEPVLARAAALGLPVVVHPALEPLPETFDDFMLGATLGPVYSSSVAAARLVLSGTLDRIPELVLIVPHLAGVLPYVAQRIEDFGNGGAEHPFTYYLKNRIYTDNCSFHAPALRCAVDTMGADRVMVGTDWPNRGTTRRAVEDVRAFFRDEPTQSMVLAGTAATLFERTGS